METAIKGNGSEIPGAANLLKMVDLRGKVVMEDALQLRLFFRKRWQKKHKL